MKPFGTIARCLATCLGAGSNRRARWWHVSSKPTPPLLCYLPSAPSKCLSSVASDDLSEGAWTAPTAATAARMHMPESFGALAIAGLVGGLLVLVSRWRLRRQLALVAGARAGLLRGNGWLEVEGERAPRRALPQVDPGPVLLFDLGRRDAHAYRGERRDEQPAAVTGTRQGLSEQLGDRIATVNAMVLGWVVPLSAPAAVGAALALWG